MSAFLNAFYLPTNKAVFVLQKKIILVYEQGLLSVGRFSKEM